MKRTQTWAKMTLDAPRDPRLLAVGPDAAWLWVIALCHINERDMHGFVQFEDFEVFTAPWWPAERARRLAAKLVKHGLWLEDADRRCWQIALVGVEAA